MKLVRRDCVWQRLVPVAVLIGRAACDKTVSNWRLIAHCSPNSIHVVEDRLADILLKVPARRQCEGSSKGVRLGKCLRVLDREVDSKVTQIGPPVALDQVHRIAMRLTGCIQPCFVVETYCV